jgi:hypothetical protein
MRKAHILGNDRAATLYFEKVYPKNLIPLRHNWDFTTLLEEADMMRQNNDAFKTNSHIPSFNIAQRLHSDIARNNQEPWLEVLRETSPPPPDDHCAAAAIKSYGRLKNFQSALDVSICEIQTRVTQCVILGTGADRSVQAEASPKDSMLPVGHIVEIRSEQCNLYRCMHNLLLAFRSMN